ncbi:MAG: hypothetical protein H0X36_07270 [Sphingomonadaceae bacterium]|nr:hypothetical protein [Sphingomonadaceae bacterium]
MAKLNGATLVAPAKIAEYLLNASHPRGAAKARFFQSFGFEVRTADDLTRALGNHPRRNEIKSISIDRAGVKSVIECRIETPDGRNPCVRTIWVLEPGATVHRFVTAYAKAEEARWALERAEAVKRARAPRRSKPQE